MPDAAANLDVAGCTGPRQGRPGTRGRRETGTLAAHFRGSERRERLPHRPIRGRDMPKRTWKRVSLALIAVAIAFAGFFAHHFAQDRSPVPQVAIEAVPEAGTASG